MANLTAYLHAFAKQGNAPQVELTSAVIYTRVSTKEQADKNHSLDTQQRYCREYAVRKGYTVVAEFGGTYESAKGDERREFKQLLDYVRQHRVGCIIVYSLDRFSRSGASAISIAADLRKVGVALESVTQPTDARTSAGELFQNMGLSFSHYDNQQRREKAVTGMREKLRRGCWVGRPPLGYAVVHTSKEEDRLVITAAGHKLRQAFMWKAAQVPNTEIVRRLRVQGVAIQLSNLTTVFCNPFCCGLLTHSLLPGELIPSRHPALISQEVFLQVNEVQRGKQPGYEVSAEVPQVPLKQHVRCGKCEALLTGYQVKAKGLWYYKCNTKACRVNISAKTLHTQFEGLLVNLTLPDHLIGPLGAQLAAVFAQLNQGQAQQRVDAQQQLREAEQKLETLEERFVMGEITGAQFEKYGAKIRAEQLAPAQAEAQRLGTELSNSAELSAQALQLAGNPPTLWNQATLNNRRRLQNLVFPEGTGFDKQNGLYRTGRLNVIFELINGLSAVSNEKKKELPVNSDRQSNWMGPLGIEQLPDGAGNYLKKCSSKQLRGGRDGFSSKLRQRYS